MQIVQPKIGLRILRKTQGFALMTELASLMIFGLGMLALSTLSEKTVSASSESLQRTHASWLVNSLISYISMNTEESRYLSYKKENLSCNNRASPPSRTAHDLNVMFCKSQFGDAGMNQTKPIDVMGEVNWSVTCTDSDTSDSIPCSKNSTFHIMVSWEAAGIGTLSDTKSIAYDYNL